MCIAILNIEVGAIISVHIYIYIYVCIAILNIEVVAIISINIYIYIYIFMCVLLYKTLKLGQ